jgi:hypothetical protein
VYTSLHVHCELHWQAQEIESLRIKIQEMTASKDAEVCLVFFYEECCSSQCPLVACVVGRESVFDLQASSQKQKEAEEEQEDLLVLLNELSNKRRGDEEKMRAANLEVSEDEGDEDDEEEE